MPRPLRDLPPGSLWHVTCHGLDDHPIVRGDDDRRLWVGLLSAAGRRAAWRLHAWCLLDTHYHLLLEVGPHDVSRALQYLNGMYAQEFNRRYARRGHVWESRFRAWAVDGEDHFANAVAYILGNAVRAGLVEQWQDWPWLGGLHVDADRTVGAHL